MAKTNEELLDELKAQGVEIPANILAKYKSSKGVIAEILDYFTQKFESSSFEKLKETPDQELINLFIYVCSLINVNEKFVDWSVEENLVSSNLKVIIDSLDNGDLLKLLVSLTKTKQFKAERKKKKTEVKIESSEGDEDGIPF